MGKADERRKAYRMKYLTQLSFDDPDRFASEWEFRLQSWLGEVALQPDSIGLSGKEKCQGLI